MKHELLNLLSKMMSGEEFPHKIAGDEKLMSKSGLDKSLRKEIKKKSRAFLLHRTTNIEQTAESGPSSSGDSITSSRRPVNWSIKEKTDLLVMVNAHRAIIESKKRDKTTMSKRQDAWENITSQFKIKYPKFKNSDTNCIINCYRRMKSQVKKKLTDQGASKVSGASSCDKSIMKLICEICQGELKDYRHVVERNDSMLVEQEDETSNINEESIDATENRGRNEPNTIDTSAKVDQTLINGPHLDTNYFTEGAQNVTDTPLLTTDYNTGFTSELFPIETLDTVVLCKETDNMGPSNDATTSTSSPDTSEYLNNTTHQSSPSQRSSHQKLSDEFMQRNIQPKQEPFISKRKNLKREHEMLVQTILLKKRKVEKRLFKIRNTTIRRNVSTNYTMHKLQKEETYLKLRVLRYDHDLQRKKENFKMALEFLDLKELHHKLMLK